MKVSTLLMAQQLFTYCDHRTKRLIIYAPSLRIHKEICICILVILLDIKQEERILVLLDQVHEQEERQKHHSSSFCFYVKYFQKSMRNFLQTFLLAKKFKSKEITEKVLRQNLSVLKVYVVKCSSRKLPSNTCPTFYQIHQLYPCLYVFCKYLPSCCSDMHEKTRSKKARDSVLTNTYDSLRRMSKGGQTKYTSVFQTIYLPSICYLCKYRSDTYVMKVFCEGSEMICMRLMENARISFVVSSVSAINCAYVLRYLLLSFCADGILCKSCQFSDKCSSSVLFKIKNIFSKSY